MAKNNHPWVQDFTSFEAVLCSCHDVHAWDQAASLRAYQTYGFDDATTPGSDTTFRHIETGVVLQHDGDVVAIQFGNGSLAAAFEDLFQVLSALGWKRAEVHHPPETLPALLNDMGRAIPARMDFDVIAARADAKVERSAEAHALVEQGRALLQGVASNQRETHQFNELALRELASMDAMGTGPTAQPRSPAAGAATGEVPVADQHASVVPAPVRGPVLLEDEGEPMVPILSASAPTVLREAGDQHAGKEAIGNPPLLAPPNDMPPGIRVAPPRPARDAPQGYALHEQARNPVGSKLQETTPSLDEVDAAPTVGTVGTTCHVGRSALCFDLPNGPFDQGRVRGIARELAATEVVHVWPGQAGQRYRWDLAGEVDLAAPWFAEVIADTLIPGDATSAILFAMDLVSVVRDGAQATLRALVNRVLANEGAVADWRLAEGPAAAYRQAVLAAVGGVCLSKSGEAFVDIEAQAAITPFSVSSISKSNDAVVYVVHLDAADGRFVANIVGLLQYVAACRARSTRAQAQERALEEERERQEALQREASEQQARQRHAAEKVQRTLMGLVDELRTMGVSVAIPEV